MSVGNHDDNGINDLYGRMSTDSGAAQYWAEQAANGNLLRGDEQVAKDLGISLNQLSPQILSNYANEEAARGSASLPWYAQLVEDVGLGAATAGIAPEVSAAAGGGITGAAAGGAAAGAANSALAGAFNGNLSAKGVGEGALLGGVSGGLSKGLQGAGLSPTESNIATKATTGAIGGALSGRGAGAGALSGATNAVAGSVLTSGNTIFQSGESAQQTQNPTLTNPTQTTPTTGTSTPTVGDDGGGDIAPIDTGTLPGYYGTGLTPEQLSSAGTGDVGAGAQNPGYQGLYTQGPGGSALGITPGINQI